MAEVRLRELRASPLDLELSLSLLNETASIVLEGEKTSSEGILTFTVLLQDALSFSSADPRVLGHCRTGSTLAVESLSRKTVEFKQISSSLALFCVLSTAW